MAENIDDGELWLPSEFLPDDFFLDRRPSGDEFGSDLSFMSTQPVTETEGDEENYIAGLTLQMAHSFLHENDDESSLLARDYPKAMAGSPQSTLSRVGSWSGSNKGSPNGPSQVSSPPSTPFSQQASDDAWDLLSSHPVPVPSKNPITQTKPLVNQQQQMQAERFYQLKQQQQQRQLIIQQQLSAAWGRQQSTSSGNGGGGYGEGIRCGRSSAWRQHRYPQSGSGMRAVFLSGSDTSAGTGVFLPRTPGNPTDLRKKPNGTTVLLPDRVIQALNLNLDEMGVHQRLHNRTSQRKGNYHRPPSTSALADTEHRLPDEWTY